MKFETVVVMDCSSVARSLLAQLVKPYAKAVVSVDSLDGVQRLLPQLLHPSLLILEIDDSGKGFQLIEQIAGQETQPSILATTVHPRLEDETRASMLGAIGYIAKPVSLGAVRRVLRLHEGDFTPTAPRVRGVPLGDAVVFDPETKEAQFRWAVADMSRTGAFLETHSPVRIGTRLQMLLELESEEIPVEVEVVRIQEPDWGVIPGVAVVFRIETDQTRQRLEGFVDRNSQVHAHA